LIERSNLLKVAGLLAVKLSPHNFLVQLRRVQLLLVKVLRQLQTDPVVLRPLGAKQLELM